MTDLQRAAGLATIALGAGQAFAPRATAKVFGLDEVDGQQVWLARLLGVSNLALGSLALDPHAREVSRTATRGVLAGNAAATVAGTASGALSKRIAALVLGFIAALAAADAAGD